MIPAMGRELAPQVEADVSHGLVLIVDESLPVRLALVEILQKMGTPGGHILQATTPEEALRTFREKRPHVIITEFIGVHPEDGLEVIHEMLEADPHARVVLLTSEPREGPEVRAALRAGVFAFLEKPIRHEKIRAILQELEAEEGGIERFR